MTEHSYPNFKTLCRLCLQAGTAEINIFPKDSDNVGGCQLSIPVRIMACAALEVQSMDSLPKSICTECRYQLEKSYYFRKRCQLSDNRLKKHLRLLYLGKKSRIFNRNEEDEDEDELEFVDSLEFIKKREAECIKEDEERIRKDVERKVKKELRLVIMDEVKLQLHSEVKDEVRNELRDEIWQEVKNELRLEVWNEVKAELRQEVVADVREGMKMEMRDELLAQAKLELRNEVKDECREAEKQILLGELGDFLKSRSVEKQQFCRKNIVNACNQNSAHLTKPKQKIIDKPNETMNRVCEVSVDVESQIQKYAVENEGSTSVNEISSTEQNVSLIVAQRGNVGDNNDNETETNFFVIDQIEEDEEEEEEIEDNIEEKGHDDANTYFAEEESSQFQVSETSDNSTTYQIEDIQFFKKGTSNSKQELDETEEGGTEENLLIFHADFAQDESEDHIMEIVDVDKKEIIIKRCPSEMNASSSTAASSLKNKSPLVLRTNDVTKTFQCSDCPQLFATEHSLYRHMMMHKKLEQKGVSYQCSNCHIYFSCKSSLNRHMLKHTGRRPFSCEECGKSFIQREILKRHLLTHSGIRPYTCSHCERSFLQKLNLKQHIEKFHTDNPKVQQYPCHMCPKRFNHASGLSRHLATHSGLAFQCPECERTFTDRSSVKRHILHMHKTKLFAKTEKIQEHSV